VALAGSVDFYNNIISDITIANDLFEACYFTGFFGTSGSQNFYNNMITDIHGISTYSGAQLIGMTLPTGEGVSVYNNMISNFTVSAGSSVQSIKLMNCPNNFTTASNYIAHNTLHLDATGSATNFTSTALYLNALDVELTNNIICNTSNHLGTGKTNAIEKHASMAITEILSTSNNNAIYAGTPAAGNNILYDGAIGYTTLAAYQALVSPAENNTITLDPLPFFTSASDVHISLCAGCPLENAGQPEPPVVNDYDYETRSASAPEIGADEITELLPVNLIEFNATDLGTSIRLNWYTANEQNSDYFEIQHSVDGMDFVPVGRVSGSGTSSMAHEYDFVHYNTLTDINYYRLKIVDWNGDYDYSPIVAINRNKVSDFTTTLAHNPFTSQLCLEARTETITPVDISIISIQNNIHINKATTLSAGAQSVCFDTETLPAGMYVVTITNGKTTVTLKALKQ